MWRQLCISIFWLATVNTAHAATPYLSPRNTEAPFCYVHGHARSWPFISGELPEGSRVAFTARQDGQTLASGKSLSFAGNSVRLTEANHLEIISLTSEPAISFSLAVTITLPDGNTETQQLTVRPAPPDRPISYLADFGDDLIRLFMDSRDGHWRPISKDAFDQYFRRCQAHGVSRLILWQSPYPYICDPSNYTSEEWDRYEKQTQAMLESRQFERLISKLKQRGVADPKWGLHVPWGWVRQLCGLRLQRNLGPMIAQSAAEHGIALTASFRPFETALTKYYEIPTFDQNGQFLWGFLPLATPIVNYRPEDSCFAHYRTILNKMGHEASGRIHAIEFNDVENADAFRKRHRKSHDNLQIAATNFPPIQEDSLILQRQADGKFVMRPFGEIQKQAEATRLVLEGYQLEIDGSRIRISGLNVPGDYRYLVLSNPAAADEALELSALDPVRLWARAGNRLGRENVFWALDESLDAGGRTKTAGIPSTGRDHTEFHATEAGRKLLQDGSERLPLKGHQLVIDLGAPWSVEMMDLNRPAMRENAIKEMATLLKLPAFDELFINTRSHVSLSAYKGDGEEGIRTLAHYSKAGKRITSWLGIDRAYAPIATASDSVLQLLAANPRTTEKVTTCQTGEWLEYCQTEDSPFRWRYVRNREVATGVRKFLVDLQQAFPGTRTRIVLPLSEKSVLAVKDGLETLRDPKGNTYHRNYSRVWSTINHIRSIGEGMAMVQLNGLATEPVLFGVRGLPDSDPLQLYLDHSRADLASNRGSSFRGPRSFFFEAQESLRAKDTDAARLRREAIVCQLLDPRQEIGEVILYEAADWLYYLPLSNPEICGYGFLDHCINKVHLTPLKRAKIAATGSGRRQRFIYNTDGDNMFIYKDYPMSAEDLHGYVDEIVDAGVTTLHISSHVGMDMNFQGEMADLLGSHPNEEEAEKLKDPHNTPLKSLARAAVNFRGLIDAGHDPLGLVIERAQAKKLEAFVSFRLNEVHGVERPANMLLSKFWLAHPEWHVAKMGDEVPRQYLEILGPRTSPIVASWLHGGLNFAVPEVRARKLNQLREICERYPLDGIEIDFQRFPVYFPFGKEEENIGIMTAWMREVRAMVKEVGEQRGKPVLLTARVMAKPEQNLGIGLDPVTWAKEGLLDSVIISHYLHNNFPLPVQEYRGLFPDILPLYASIEVEKESDSYRAIANRLWSDGVDGIMMFNFFTCRERGVEPDFAVLPEVGRPASRVARPMLLVANKHSDTLSYIDHNSMTVEQTINVGPNPHELVITPDQRLMYLSNYAAPGNTISVVDLMARKHIKQIPTGEYTRIHGAAMAPDGKNAYFTAGQTGWVVEIDTATHAVTRAIPTHGKISHMVLVSNDNRRIYTANIVTENVSVIDRKSGELITQIQCEEGAEGMAFTPDGKQLWVANQSGESMSIIDIATHKVVERFDLPGMPVRIKFTRDGQRAYVPSWTPEGELIVIDVPSRKEIKRVRVGGYAIGVELSPDEKRAFVGCEYKDGLHVVNTETLEVEGTIDTGDGPDPISMWYPRRPGEP